MRDAAMERSELRGWLRRAIRFGLLAKLPPEFDPFGDGATLPTADYAELLLASLRDPNRRPIAEIVAEVRSFRGWVEAQLRATRRTLMAEARIERIDLDRLAPPRRTEPPSEKPPQPPPHLRERKEPNPLWDRWLDG